MPITPWQLADDGAVARLTDDERVVFERAMERMDAVLLAQWQMVPLQVQTDAMGPRVAGALARAYTEAGWSVGLEALDGAMGKAGELLRAGAPVAWRVTLVARWEQAHMQWPMGVPQ